MAREEPSRDGAEQGDGPHRVTIHGPNDPENPSPGNHHTVTHHADGSEEHADHASAEEAGAHASEQLGGHELGDPGEDAGEEQAEVCPECGAEMEGGTCPECGYSADKGAIAGQHEEEEQAG